jgi:hypothetical protein
MLHMYTGHLGTKVCTEAYYCKYFTSIHAGLPATILSCLILPCLLFCSISSVARANISLLQRDGTILSETCST